LATSVIATGVPRQRITFAYDYLGRRVRKTVANWNASAYITAVDRKFIYDGWNLIAELALNTSTSTFVLNSTYTWGLDLSKTLQDGGGVGGLLAIKLHAEPGAPVLLPAYDGNGNIAALVNRVGGALLAAYEYDAFGQTIRASGTHADKNNFRFSTKYTDAETGLLYYGRRYYNPTLGRWLGRDPIAEKGGLHLYGFTTNNPVNRWDLLGMNSPVMMAAFVVKADRILSGDMTGTEGDSDDWIVIGEPGRQYLRNRRDLGTDDIPLFEDGSAAPKKPDLSKLPGCSELRKQIDAGTYKPTLTVQSFIRGDRAWGFRGDGNAGFTDSPRTGGFGQTYRTSFSYSYGGTEVSGGVGSTHYEPFGIHLATGTATPSGEFSAAEAGDYSYRFSFWANASNSLTPGAPPIDQSGFVQVDYTTGLASGTFKTSDYPSHQFFLNGQSIYTDAQGSNLAQLFLKSDGTANGVPVCDPSR